MVILRFKRAGQKKDLKWNA